MGFMHKFIEYPMTLQMFSFTDQQTPSTVRGPINARSKDSLMVNFRASFQYKLQEGKLVELYRKYGEDYKSPCIRFAVDSMNDQAS